MVIHCLIEMRAACYLQEYITGDKIKQSPNKGASLAKSILDLCRILVVNCTSTIYTPLVSSLIEFLCEGFVLCANGQQPMMQQNARIGI